MKTANIHYIHFVGNSFQKKTGCSFHSFRSERVYKAYKQYVYERQIKTEPYAIKKEMPNELSESLLNFIKEDNKNQQQQQQHENSK